MGIAFGQAGSPKKKEAPTSVEASVRFVTMFSTDADVDAGRTPCQRFRDFVVRPVNDVAGERPAVCDKVLDIVAGKASYSPGDLPKAIQAARLAVDSRSRVVITEPTTRTIHVLDFANRKSLRIDGTSNDRLFFPYSVAVDANDSIYVTDLDRGRIAVFDEKGKFRKYIGDFKGEGAFERPLSIAIHRAAGRIYVADYARCLVLILDLNGRILAKIGKRGGGDGPAEFRGPAEIAIYGNEVFVLDKRDFRAQVLDLNGHFLRQFRLGGSGGRDANGMAFDTQGRLMVSALNWVEVFDREGNYLFRFGDSGSGPGQFDASKALCTDSKDRVYVVDSGNHRIQVFQLTEQPRLRTAASQ